MNPLRVFFKYVHQLTEKIFVLHWMTEVLNYPETTEDEFDSSVPYTVGSLVKRTVKESVKINQNVLYIVTECLDTGNWFEPKYRVKTELLGTFPINKPILDWHEEIEMLPGEMPNYTGDKPLWTTIGKVYLNYRIYVAVVGDRIPYHNDEWTQDSTNKTIEHYLKNKLITNEETFMMLGNAVEVGEFTDISNEGLTSKTWTTHPDVPKVKAEMLAKMSEADKRDPFKIIELEDRLMSLDKQHVEGDKTKIFHDGFGKKSYSMHRKKLLLMFGGVSSFDPDEGYVCMTNSLHDGYDMDKFHVYVNETYKGSSARGKETATAGEKTKYNFRIYQDIKIISDDCKPLRGMKIELGSDLNSPAVLQFLDRYTYPEAKVVDLEYLKKNLGKVITLRDPNFCRAGSGLCYRCTCNQLYENQEDRLNGYPVEITSSMLAVSLAIFHGTSLDSTTTNLRDHLITIQ